MRVIKLMSVSSVSEIVKNGIWFDPKNWSDLMPTGDDIAIAINRLFELLAERQVDYLLVGGIALLSYVDGGIGIGVGMRTI